MKKLITITALLILLTNYAGAQIINVPADQPTIQAGIDAANNGDTVLVSQGTYLENINFNGKAITVASNYIVEPDSAHINNTIIDGSDPDLPEYSSVVTFITGEDTTSVLNGFTITGGTGLYLASYDAWVGGGIACYYSTARIINNKIINNEVNGNNYAWGGGIASINETGGCWTVVENNIIRNNQSVASGLTATGGGVEIWGNARISNNIVEENNCICESGFSGGGGIVVQSENIPPDTLYLNNNTIKNNSSTANQVYGGGAHIYGVVALAINNNAIIHNRVITNDNEWWGAGIYCYDLKGTSEISNNVFAFNSGPVLPLGAGGGLCIIDAYDTKISIDANKFLNDTAYHGGGIFELSSYNLIITNNLFSGNYSYRGGAIGMFHPQIDSNNPVYLNINRPQIINNTFYNNTASYHAGAIRLNCEVNIPVMFNNIFHENDAPNTKNIYYMGSEEPLVISYSDIDTDEVFGPWTGEGNINVDPQFVEGDLLCHLTEESQCINKGTYLLLVDETEYYCPITDFDGENRPDTCATIPDIGADEVMYDCVGEEELRASGFELQTFPIPCSDFINLHLTLNSSHFTMIDLYSIEGKMITHLLNEEILPGEHDMEFDVSDLPAGVYFVRMQAGGVVETAKIIITD